MRFIKAAKPGQNSYIERFNRTYREEILRSYLFGSLGQVRDSVTGGQLLRMA